jgi:ABC-type molybdate transport system substrate-binding protein
MYELGYLALQDGSTVLEVSTRLKPDTLEKLAEQLEPHNDVLLLIDYIETQHDFIQFAQELASINATLELRVRYVACCRSSYFPVVQHAGDASTDFLHLDLAFDHRLADWLQSYRYGTVQHILKATGVPESIRQLEMCGQTPVLAVFFAWLHENGRREELDELLDHENGEFGTWLTKRVQKSFPKEQPASRPLAELLSFFPMKNDQVSLLRNDKTFDRLLDRLQVDGWVEHTSNSGADEDRWETAHDVLADQVLISCATRWPPKKAEEFIARLFDLAADIGVVESVLVTLQWVANLPPFKAVDWEPLLRRAASSRSDAWQDLHVETGGTGFVYESWLGYESWVRAGGDVTVVEPEMDAWLELHQEDAEARFVYNSWLDAGGDVSFVEPSIMAWLEKHQEEPDAHYVYKSWLDAGGDVSFVEPSIKAWLELHQEDADAKFVYKSWLDAGGDVSFVEPSIKAWLELHQAAAEAEFVYKSWLDAGGDVSFVEPSIKAWLELHQEAAKAEFVYKSWLDAGGDVSFVKSAIGAWMEQHQEAAEAAFVYQSWLAAGGEFSVVASSMLSWVGQHGSDAEADFVYRAWLENGGDFELIREPATAWLHEHCMEQTAGFVTKALSRKDGLRLQTVRDILTWCRKFPNDEDAIWRIAGLGFNLNDRQLSRDLVETAAVVVPATLSVAAEQLTPQRRSILLNVMFFVHLHTCDAPPDDELCQTADRLFERWCRHSSALGAVDEERLFDDEVIRRCVFRIATRIAAGGLDIVQDRDAILRFIDWFNTVPREWKRQCSGVFRRLRQLTDDNALWDRVEI